MCQRRILMPVRICILLGLLLGQGLLGVASSTDYVNPIVIETHNDTQYNPPATVRGSDGNPTADSQRTMTHDDTEP